jgi:RNA polymerase sigma-70 factor (ECF subfamily)
MYGITENTHPERNEIQLISSGARPDRLLFSREINYRQTLAIKRLTATEYTAFILRHMEEKTIDEIATALNIAPNAAKQAVYRAIQKLRQSLLPLWVK